MIKQGIYVDKEGVTYNTYEIDLEKFYRFDIVKDGGVFHLEPDNVLYSVVKRKKKTYLYGNTALKDAIESLKDKLKFAKLPIASNIFFEEGKLCRSQIKGESNDYFYKVVERSGSVDEETYRDGTAMFYNFRAKSGADIEMVPFNIEEYQCADIAEGAYVSKSPYASIEVLKSRFNLKHIEARDYIVVETLEQARGLLKRIRKAMDVTGFDFETSGLEVNLYGEDVMVGCVVSHQDKSSYYFPFAHTDFPNLPMSFFDELIEVLQVVAEEAQELSDKAEKEGNVWWNGIIKTPDGGARFVGLGAHNTKFEQKVLRKYKKKLRIKHDSMQLDIAYNPRQGRGLHALKNVQEEIEGHKYLEFEDVFLDKSNINFADVDKVIARYYACPDADGLRRVLYDRFNRMNKECLFIYELESDLAEVKADQEYWGIRIDAEAYLKGYKIVKDTIKSLEEYIKILAKWPDIKITSNDSLAELLYSRMGCPVYVETKEGKPSTGAAALKKLSKQKREEELKVVSKHVTDSSGKPIIFAEDLNKSKFPIVLFLEKYREYSKLMTAFYARIEKSASGYFFRDVNDELQIEKKADGKPCLRYFFWINANGAASGRQSSPAHQFPKSIKGYCLPDSSEHRFIGTDYSQVELRLFFSYSGETAFIELCKDPGNDIHRVIGAIISKLEMWEISQEMRSKDKQRNFGVVYLMSGFGLAVQKYGPGPTKAQVKECQKSIDDLFHEFKGAKKFVEDNKKKVLRDGYMKTKLGRYRFFDSVFDPDISREKLMSAVRQGNNTPVQGTAADVMKIAEVEMFKWIERKGWDKLVKTPEGEYPMVRVVISAHDESLVSYHEPSVDVEEVLEMIRDCMEMTFEGWAPLFGSSSIVDNWLEGKKDAYALPIELRNTLIDNYKKTGKTCMTSSDHKHNMVDIINKYRDESLVLYMEELVKKSGEDATKLAALIKHPTLTHDLISRFPQSEEHNQKHGKLTHTQNIQYAAERYLEFRLNPDFKFEGPAKSEVQEDHDMKESMEDILGLTDKLYDYDAQGNQVYLDDTEAIEEDDFLMFGEEEADSLDITMNGGTMAVWEILDEYLVDFEGLFPDQCNAVLEALFKESEKNGFSRVTIIYNGKSRDTGMRANRLDKFNINKMISEFHETNKEQRIV